MINSPVISIMIAYTNTNITRTNFNITRNYLHAILYPEFHARLALHLYQRYFSKILQKRYKSKQKSLIVTNS